jgi:hypothetical protein
VHAEELIRWKPLSFHNKIALQSLISGTLTTLFWFWCRRYRGRMPPGIQSLLIIFHSYPKQTINTLLTCKYAQLVICSWNERVQNTWAKGPSVLAWIGRRRVLAWCFFYSLVHTIGWSMNVFRAKMSFSNLESMQLKLFQWYFTHFQSKFPLVKTNLGHSTDWHKLILVWVMDVYNFAWIGIY